MRPLLSVRCSSSTAPAGPHQQKARSLPDNIRGVASTVQHAHRQAENHVLERPSRRHLLLAGTATAALAAQLVAPRCLQQRADADEASLSLEQSTSSSLDLQLYENTKQQYRLQVPAAWERKEKAGLWHHSIRHQQHQQQPWFLVHCAAKGSKQYTGSCRSIKVGLHTHVVDMQQEHIAAAPAPPTLPWPALTWQVLMCCLRTLSAAPRQ